MSIAVTFKTPQRSRNVLFNAEKQVFNFHLIREVSSGKLQKYRFGIFQLCRITTFETKTFHRLNPLTCKACHDIFWDFWRNVIKNAPCAQQLAAISTVTAPSVSFVQCRSVFICCALQNFTIRFPFLIGEQDLYEPIQFKAVKDKHRAISFQLPASVLLSQTTGSNSTALFCLMQLSPEPAAETLFDFLFRSVRKDWASRRVWGIFVHLRARSAPAFYIWSTFVENNGISINQKEEQLTPKNKRKWKPEKLTPRPSHTAVSSLRGQITFHQLFHTCCNHQPPYRQTCCDNQYKELLFGEWPLGCHLLVLRSNCEMKPFNRS